MIASELLSNRNTSITNRCEYLAAQVLKQVLPQQQARNPHFIWIEHYAWRSPGAHFPPEWSTVTFSHYGPRWFLPWTWFRSKLEFGDPDWQDIERSDIERLIGEPLPDPPDQMVKWGNLREDRFPPGPVW